MVSVQLITFKGYGFCDLFRRVLLLQTLL